jgi:hypothetical protein
VDPLFRWIVAGAFLLASPFTIIGALEAYDTAAQQRHGESALGSVVANHLSTTERDGMDEHAYQPEVSFNSRDGLAHRFTDGVGSLPPDYEPGAKVSVLYPAAHPERARIASWKRLWLVPSIFVSVGLLPGIVAWVVVSRISRFASLAR